MRVLTAFAALGLLASAFFASRYYTDRRGSLPLAQFVTTDPRERVRDGAAGRRLGEELAGWEDLAAADPSDIEALRNRIRVGILIGAVAFGHPGLDELVKAQTDAYLERREEIDPDGSFLDGVIETWVKERLHFPWEHRLGFYARTSVAIYLAARRDPAGEKMMAILAQNPLFYTQVFPYIRRYRPAWPAVEPLIVRFLEADGLGGRVEAGVTLLEYNTLFGVGGDLIERHREDIKAAVDEVRTRLRRASVDEDTAMSGRSAVVGMGLLAVLGDADERRELEAASSERVLRYYVPHADTVRLARLMAGIDSFDTLPPMSERFKDLDTRDKELYYFAAAQRALEILREKGDAGRGEIGEYVDLLEAAFDGGFPGLRCFVMQVLCRIAPARGAALVERAIRARGTLSIYGGILADDPADPVAIFLPALRSPEPDLSALAAVSLLDRGPTRALQK